ncbi:MAG TPA: phosphate signaling complex protein PhoU [Geminicoccaceae bacterium]|nr:phosphate signaling complex protein PhoU [Geminicoccaceae bacterium]
MPASHIVKSYDQQIAFLTRKILEMGGLVEQQIAGAIEALVNRDAELAARVVEQDDQIDRMEEEIDQYAIRLLATRQPMAIDLRLIAMAMKISNDLERIGDYSTNIAKRGARLAKEPPVKPLYTIPRMAQISQAMVKDILDAYVERDADKALAVWHRDDEVDDMFVSLFRELLTYMMEDPRNISPCTELLFVAKNLERIGDHTTNIAEKIHYMIHGQRINRMPEAER